MNDTDKAAFEKWLASDCHKAMNGKDAWQAALEYERENNSPNEAYITMLQETIEQERQRSQKLFEALENCLKIFSLSGSARTILNKALQEYRGET